MFGNLSLFKWSTEKYKGTLAAPKGWNLDRNWDRVEGERLLKLKKYAAAETHLLSAVAECNAQHQPVSKRVHLGLLLAEAQRRQCAWDDEDITKLDEAAQTAHAALEAAAQGRDRELYDRCLDMLADIFASLGRFDAVEKVMLEAIQADVNNTRDQLGAARRVVRLGVARHRMGRVQDAIPVLEKAVALHEAACGKDHVETANQLTELGAAYRAAEDHEKAQECLRRAMKIHQAAGGLDAPAAIQALHHLAGSLEEVGDLEGAALQYETALMYKLRTIGSDLDDLAELQYGLANLHVSWHNYARARELLYEAAGNFRRKGGMRLAVTYETMAFVDECSGRYSEAVQQLALAAKVWDAMRPERTPELIRNMERRIDLLKQIRRKGDASVLAEKIENLKRELDDDQLEKLAAFEAAKNDGLRELALALEREKQVQPEFEIEEASPEAYAEVEVEDVSTGVYAERDGETAFVEELVLEPEGEANFQREANFEREAASGPEPQREVLHRTPQFTATAYDSGNDTDANEINLEEQITDTHRVLAAYAAPPRVTLPISKRKSNRLPRSI